MYYSTILKQNDVGKAEISLKITYMCDKASRSLKAPYGMVDRLFP